MVYLLNDKIEEVIVILRSDLYFVWAVLIRLGLGASCPGQELLWLQVVHYTSVPCLVLIWHPPRYLYAWSLTRVHLPSVIQGICCSSGHCWDICHLWFWPLRFFCGTSIRRILLRMTGLQMGSGVTCMAGCCSVGRMDIFYSAYFFKNCVIYYITASNMTLIGVSPRAYDAICIKNMWLLCIGAFVNRIWCLYLIW